MKKAVPRTKEMVTCQMVNTGKRYSSVEATRFNYTQTTERNQPSHGSSEAMKCLTSPPRP